MDKSRFARLVDVVGDALECPPADRDARLVESCADDAALLAEAREYVAEAERTSASSVTSRLDEMVARAATVAEDRYASRPERIGAYRILRELGRGGMGVVYLARQHEPVRRDVAIKVVRRGLADSDTLLRFAVEEQALALMQHPNIARLLDAGETQDGRPYFVMELVDGVPITEFASERQLPLRGILELFRAVCLAVQHAHQRGVVHRDIKPSNILVTTGDDGAVPKVIDFGIAKAVEGLLSGGSAQTRQGSVLGTVDYMSPEQLRGRSEDIDTRTDIYSLGIVLYELVTGRHPFDRTTLRQAGLIDAQRILLETEPDRPSRNTVGAGAPGGLSTRRRREELDWIVMKAIEKDPERRYQTPRELADDLARFLADEPVVARPPSFSYRTRKFVRRHRVGVVAASTVGVALLAGTALSVRGSLVAAREAERAQAISDFLSDMLGSVRPEQEGREVTVRETLDDARARLEAGEFSERPDIDASLAYVIGYSYEGLGRYPDAIALYERAATLREQEGAPDDDALFRARYRLGTALWKRGDLEEALALRHELARSTERLFGPEHWEHAESFSNLANTYADMGDLDRAEEYLAEAVAVGRRLEGDEGALHLARFLNNLGTVYDDQEDFPAAVEAFEEALAIRRDAPGDHADEVAITLSNLAGAQAATGENEQAERTYRESIALAEEIYGPEHPRTAAAYSGLASVLAVEGRLEEAEALARAAVQVRVATSGGNWRVALERAKLARILAASDRPEDALVELAAAWEGLVEAGEAETRGGDIASEAARVLVALGRPDEARLWEGRVGER